MSNTNLKGTKSIAADLLPHNLFLSHLIASDELKRYIQDTVVESNEFDQQSEYIPMAANILLCFIVRSQYICNDGKKIMQAQLQKHLQEVSKHADAEQVDRLTQALQEAMGKNIAFPYGMMLIDITNSLYNQDDAAIASVLNTPDVKTKYNHVIRYFSMEMDQQVSFLMQLTTFLYQQFKSFFNLSNKEILNKLNIEDASELFKIRGELEFRIQWFEENNEILKRMNEIRQEREKYEEEQWTLEHENMDYDDEDGCPEFDESEIDSELLENAKAWLHKRNNRPNLRPETLEQCKQFLKKWSPKKIVEYLNRFIAGQDDAKWEMALMCYEHVCRVINPVENLRRSNYIMCGPTGCGKTEMVRRLKTIMPVPIEILDVNAITATGWVGLEKEDLMFELLDQEPDLESGILVLDEFDKLCTPSHSSGGDKVHVRNQANLLKMIEGTTLHRNQRSVSPLQQVRKTMKTHNITFVCAGAFTGAFDEEPVKTFGFLTGNEPTGKSSHLVSEKLIAFGMMPEMAGRIGTVIPLKRLSEEDLYEIVTQKEDTFATSAKRQAALTYGIDISMTDDAIREICNSVSKQDLGARPLQGTIQLIYHDAIKNILKQEDVLNNKKLKITKKLVQQLLQSENFQVQS